MNEFSSLNGYIVKDATARETINTLRTDLTELISEETYNRQNDISTEITNRTNNDNNLQNQINSLASGSPKGVYATVSDLTTADPDHNSVYLVTYDGKWYYYDTTNEEWTEGGEYQSALPQYLTRDYLDSYYNSKQLINDAVDLNSIKEEGMYLIASNSGANNPFGTTGLLVVNSNAIQSSNIWVIQLFMNAEGNKVARRTLRFNNDGTFHSAQAWQNVSYNETISNKDFNTIIDEGIYLNVTTTNSNMPFNVTGILKVDRVYKLADSNKWILQTYYHSSMSKIGYRILRCNPVTSAVVTDSGWKIINFDNSIQLGGKKIVNFGDSIFGNVRNSTSVSSYIQEITQATVYNVGFGGCQMSDSDDTTWSAFSMCNLATAIATNDFTAQDTAIADTTWSTKPSYFNDQLTLLKSIDFSSVDYITIAYGTNDYTAGDLLDNNNNLKDKDTFAGALRYSIETILTAYPNIKIFLGSPMFRLWLNDGRTEIVATSDERTFDGNFTLIDMTEKVKDIAKDYHLPFINAYDNLSLNRFNWTQFFDSTDTTHPKEDGRKLLGRLYGMNILNN